MTEWWAYGLSDFLMFSARTWQRTLELHNRDWFPSQALATLLATVMLFALRARAAWAPRAALLAMAMAWGFVAWAFHWQRYAPINWAAQYFAAGFALQALLLAWRALAAPPARVADGGLRSLVGDLLLAAAILYPLLALAAGRPPVETEWVGLMPDPTVLATLGLLLSLHGGRNRLLLPLPLLWCAITGATLWTLKSPQWWLAPLAGVLALAAFPIPPRAAPP
ncbi:DUF6064 family protein [Caenimonas terrae]|uniref:DUF6064 family protein n=1 Tax=Caenimonas terrae TaxID=696074 RepID=A0ABW0NGV0_9BURK